jgi:hypothetical protein
MFKFILTLALGLAESLNGQNLSGKTSVAGKLDSQRFYPVDVDLFQDFSSGVSGTFITDAQLTSGALGGVGGTWFREPPGAYTLLYTTNSTAVAFQTPIRVNGTIVASTGTKWLRIDHGGTTSEAAEFSLPGGSGGSFTQLVVRLFVRCGETNAASGNNLDYIVNYGNGFAAIQNQIGSNTRKIIAHGQAFGGATVNGASFFLAPGGTPVYEAVLIRNNTAGTLTVRFYTTPDFALVGESTTSSLDTTGVVWRVELHAGYLEDGQLSGFTEYGGVSYTWTNADVRP